MTIKYINKEAAEKILYDGCHTTDGMETLDDVVELWHMIQAIPAADVRPMVRGKWEWNEHYGLYECSNCHNSFVDEEWVKEGKWQYCPSCGACMENIHND